MPHQRTPTVRRRTENRPLVLGLLTLLVLTVTAPRASALILIAELDREQAKDKLGITMHARKNGDVGIKVWLQFRKEGKLKEFTYARLQMVDEDGKHLLSAQLQPNPVHHRQPKDVTTVAFSAQPEKLKRCRFLVVCYEGLSGTGYSMKVEDFLELDNPITE